MFKTILFLAIFGAVAYFAFDKLSADKANGESVFSSIGTSEDSPAASRAIRSVTQENYDYESK